MVEHTFETFEWIMNHFYNYTPYALGFVLISLSANLTSSKKQIEKGWAHI